MTTLDMGCCFPPTLSEASVGLNPPRDELTTLQSHWFHLEVLSLLEG